MAITQSNDGADDSNNPVADYFESSRQCTVIIATADAIRLGDIPYSGGAHMLPGSIGALDVLCEHWPDHEINYVPTAKTHRDGRTKQEIVIQR